MVEGRYEEDIVCSMPPNAEPSSFSSEGELAAIRIASCAAMAATLGRSTSPAVSGLVGGLKRASCCVPVSDAECGGKGGGMYFVVVEVLAWVNRLVFNHFDDLIHAICQQCSHDGAKPVDVVVAGEVAGDYAGPETSGRVQTAASVEYSDQLGDK